MFVLQHSIGSPSMVVDVLFTQQSAAKKLAELAKTITAEQVEWKEGQSDFRLMHAEAGEHAKSGEYFVDCFRGHE